MSYIGAEPTTVAFLTDLFSGNGSTTAFTMQVAPATTSSILVSVTGVLQSPDTYSVVGTTLTFSQAPPTGTSNISVRYLGIPASGVTTTAYRTVTDFTATAGQTTFSVPSYTVGYIDVYRNGVRLAAADYTATNGTTVVLANAATLNDSVVTESFYVSSVLNAIPATAGAVNTTYIADNAITTAKIAPGAVIQADLAAGVAGTGPAFSAYRSTNQTVSNNTAVKVQLNSEDFDTANCFDSTTDYRFTPNVAGYYMFVFAVYGTSSSNNTELNFTQIYKNGTAVAPAATARSASYTYTPANPYIDGTAGASVLVYMNGSTDYIELYGRLVGGGTLNIAQASLQGFLARAA
jgi:hypothetical protein